MLLAQRRDGMIGSGNIPNPKLSFLSLPNEVIVARASRLGVCLGVSPSQVNSSVNLLKDVENVRAVTFLKNTMTTEDDDDSRIWVIKQASNLSEDLEEEESETLADHLGVLTQEVRVSRRPKKVGNGVCVKRRSARIEKL